MNYFELYPGDYLRDTSRLGLVDHGAYLRLMMAYYSEEQPLPADYADLYTIVAAINAADKAAVRKVADRYFPVGDDGQRHNNRADEEIVKAQKRIQTARENGAKNKGKANPPANPAGMPPGTQRDTQSDTQRLTHSGEALHTPHAKDQKLPTPDGVGVAGKPAPPGCPHSEIVAAYHEILPELARVRDWTPDRQAFLRSRWREKAERQTVEWWREFFKYVRTCPFLMGEGATTADRDPFCADLEWLVRPKNFRKVIEGKYERRRA